MLLQVICNKNWHVCIFHVDLCPGIPVFACSLIWKNKRALEPALEPDCQVVPLGEPSLCLGLFQHLGHSKLTQASLQTPQQKVQHGISRRSTDHLCISVTWSLDYGVTTNKLSREKNTVRDTGLSKSPHLVQSNCKTNGFCLRPVSTQRSRFRLFGNF